MTDVLLATSEADSAAATAIEQHHAELSGALTARVAALLSAARASDEAAQREARDELVRWSHDELLPHAAAEERTLYPAAREQERARLLIDAMLAEHGELTALIDQVATAPDVVRAAAAGTALATLFASHLRKENELILPVLTASSAVSLADLLAEMHGALGGATAEAAPAAAPGGHSCGCGGHDEPGLPELDARAVPHAIRHATIFGALDGVPAGGGLILVAPHDPLPLLAQIEQRWAGIFTVEYLERGPEAWRLAFTRSA